AWRTSRCRSVRIGSTTLVIPTSDCTDSGARCVKSLETFEQSSPDPVCEEKAAPGGGEDPVREFDEPLRREPLDREVERGLELAGKVRLLLEREEVDAPGGPYAGEEAIADRFFLREGLLEGGCDPTCDRGGEVRGGCAHVLSPRC